MKSIVLKMLIGVTSTALTVTGIAVPMVINSTQDTAEASAIAGENTLAAETIADADSTSDEIDSAEEDIAEEVMTKTEYIVNDEQKSDNEDRKSTRLNSSH